MLETLSYADPIFDQAGPVSSSDGTTLPPFTSLADSLPSPTAY